MKSFARIVTLVVVCGLIAAASRAQQVRGYTLQKAIDTALQRDIRLDGLQFQLLAARAGNAIIPLRRLPQVHYRAGIAYAPTTPSFGYDPALTNGGQLSAQVIADQSLYDGGKRDLEIEQGALQLEEIEKQQALERASVRAAVTQAFYEVIRAREARDLDSVSLGEVKEQQALVTRLFSGGIAGESDRLATASEVSRAELTFQQAVTNYTLARFVFAETMALSGDTLVTALGSFDTLLNGAGPEMRRIDTAANLEIAIANKELERANLQVELSRAEKRPTLDLQGDAGLLTSIQNLQLSPRDRASILGASIGITLDGPLLDWGANGLVIEQRTREAQNKKIENLLLLRALNAESLRLGYSIRSAISNLAQARQTEDLAQQSYKRLLVVYAGGGTTLLTVLDAHKRVTDSRQTVIQILADLASSRAELERLHAH